MPYSSMEDVNPSLKGIEPPITLAQANAIASIADGIPKDKVDNPWAVAISSFKKSHKVEGGKWVRKEGSEFGKSKKEFSLTLAEHVDAPAPRLKATLAVNGIVSEKEVSIPDINYGCKALEGPDGEKLLILWTSNAFMDREGEIFETKALTDYVARADRVAERVGTPAGERGRVDYWHMDGTEFADIVWQGVEGRMLLELAAVDDTEYGRKMYDVIQHVENHQDTLPQGLSTSHLFFYLPHHRSADGVFSWMHKVKSTVMPAHRASNPYGAVITLDEGGGLRMSTPQSKVSEEKAMSLAGLVGEETAAELLQVAKEATDALEAGKVDFKENGKEAKPVVPPEEDEEEEEDMEEEEEGTKEFEQVFEMELDDDVIGAIAAKVDVKAQVQEALKELLPAAMKELQSSLAAGIKEAITGTKEEIVQQAISGTVKLTAHTASKSDDNLVPEKVKQAIEKQKERGKEDLDPVQVVVQGMMEGKFR